MKTYRDIATFYKQRGGEFSRECDYGVWWRSGGEQSFPTFRVSYVKDTGDVYAERLGGVGDKVLLLGQVQPVETDDLDIRTAWEKPLDDLLDGWADECGKPFGLQWVIDRLAGFPPQPIDLGNATGLVGCPVKLRCGGVTERTRTAAAQHAEIAARLNEWADALEKYGSEQRRDVDTEIIWWLRKGAEALEAAQRDPHGSLHSDKAEIRRLRAERDAAVARTQQLTEALRPFAEYHRWRMAKGIKGHPPALNPKHFAEALAAVGEAEEPQ